jgi:hypothetical protein
MMIEKTPHSIFLPELVLPDLLPNDYPPWRHNAEVESVGWIVKALRRYFAAPKRRGCIVNSENQMLHQYELEDARQLSLWACAVLERGTLAVEPRLRLFIDLCTPVLHNIAFRGAESLLQSFLRSLINDFDKVLAHVELPVGLWVRKCDVVRGLHVYERVHIARNARCTATRVLTRHPVQFGGMAYACAFALAYLRLRWMEKRTKMLMDVGVIPTFR